MTGLPPAGPLRYRWGHIGTRATPSLHAYGGRFTVPTALISREADHQTIYRLRQTQWHVRIHWSICIIGPRMECSCIRI